MQRRSLGAILSVFLVILGMVSIPNRWAEKTQSALIGIFTPLWEKLSLIKHLGSRAEEEIQRLQLENQLLGHELHRLQDLFHEEHLLYAQLSEALLLMPVPPEAKRMSERHAEQMQALFDLQLQALPARVIYRPPNSWNHSLWVNVGTENNEALGQHVVDKNSPVLVGASVVGVIDYVGKKQSRVRLLSDPGLSPSVRALRGGGQNRMLAEQVETLLEALASRPDLYSDAQKRSDLARQLLSFRDSLTKDAPSWYLAKGELRGSKKVLWRTHQHVLQGVGFNYDFSDEEGPARDLRSGKPQERDSKHPTVPLLRVNDLLVTTGMDGVFPPGLRVGVVTKIHPLKEGDYYYELEAKSTAGNFDDLSLVFILPPWGYNSGLE